MFFFKSLKICIFYPEGNSINFTTSKLKVLVSSQQGHTEMCSLLLEHGAEVDQQAKNGLAALHLAAQEDRVPVAQLLVKNGAEVGILQGLIGIVVFTETDRKAERRVSPVPAKVPESHLKYYTNKSCQNSFR